ncbi:MAG TPA: hypothetical protein DDX40_04800 [Rikenellaceae bacterium]|nr:hypothetical protein [Rikenellaceae bacterium]
MRIPDICLYDGISLILSFRAYGLHLKRGIEIMKKTAAIIFILLFALNGAAQSLIRSGRNEYSTPLYTWDGTCLRSGNSRYSKPLINFDGEYIRKGDNRYGEILYNWNGRELRGGRDRYSKPLFN